MDTRSCQVRTVGTAPRTQPQVLDASGDPAGRRPERSPGRRRRTRVAAIGLVAAATIAIPTQLSRVVGADAYTGSGSGSGYCSSVGGSVAGASFLNIYACNGHDSQYPALNFQCVELAERFMTGALGYGVLGVGYGYQFVGLGHQQHPSFAVGTPGVGSLPKPGDILSYIGIAGYPNYGDGHVAVVTAVTVSNGNGTITVMEENWGGNGYDIGDNGGYHTININGWKWSEWNWTSNSDFSWLSLNLVSTPSVAGRLWNLLAVNSGKCMDVNGQSTADGARIQQWQCWGGVEPEVQACPSRRIFVLHSVGEQQQVSRCDRRTGSDR